MFPFETPNERTIFVGNHPRNHLFRPVDDEFREKRMEFAALARELQHRCNKLAATNGTSSDKNNASRRPNYALAMVNYMGTDLASIHVRILQSLAQDISDATGLNTIFLNTNESNGASNRPPVLYVDFEIPTFTEAWQLDGSLEEKWTNSQTFVEDDACQLVFTLGGMYESYFAPALSTLHGKASFLYKTNEHAIPFNEYNYIFSYRGDIQRFPPLYDINIAREIYSANDYRTSNPIKLLTAMRVMDIKLGPDCPIFPLMNKAFQLHPELTWTLLGCEPNGPVYELFSEYPNVTLIPQTKTLLEFSEHLKSYDIFYHPPDHPHGGAATVLMAYLLGLVIVVTHENDAWGLIDPDSDCYVENNMDERLLALISHLHATTPNARLRERRQRVERRLTMLRIRRQRYLNELRIKLDRIRTG